MVSENFGRDMIQPSRRGTVLPTFSLIPQAQRAIDIVSYNGNQSDESDINSSDSEVILSEYWDLDLDELDWHEDQPKNWQLAFDYFSKEKAINSIDLLNWLSNSQLLYKNYSVTNLLQINFNVYSHCISYCSLLSLLPLKFFPYQQVVEKYCTILIHSIDLVKNALGIDFWNIPCLDNERKIVNYTHNNMVSNVENKNLQTEALICNTNGTITLKLKSGLSFTFIFTTNTGNNSTFPQNNINLEGSTDLGSDVIKHNFKQKCFNQPNVTLNKCGNDFKDGGEALPPEYHLNINKKSHIEDCCFYQECGEEISNENNLYLKNGIHSNKISHEYKTVHIKEPLLVCKECGKQCTSKYILEDHEKTCNRKRKYSLVYNVENQNYLCEALIHNTNGAINLKLKSGLSYLLGFTNIEDNSLLPEYFDHNAINLSGYTGLWSDEIKLNFKKKCMNKPEVTTKKRRNDFQEGGKKFQNRNDFSFHTGIHSGERPYECEDCSLRFRRYISLKQHKTVHIKEPLLVCKECGKQCASKYILEDHEKTHTRKRKYSLVYNVENQNYLCEAHIHNTNGAINLKLKSGLSYLLGFTNLEDNSLLPEYFDHNAINLSGYTGLWSDEIKLNFKKKCMNKPEVTTKKCRHDFQEGGKKFQNRNDFSFHTGIHSGERPYECEDCSLRFRRYISLKQHKTVHIKEPLLVCKECGKGYTNKNILLGQENTQTKIPTYTNCYYRKIIRNPSPPIKHTNIPKSMELQAMYICQACRQKFKYSKRIINPRRIHIVSNKCECGKNFFRKLNFILHKKKCTSRTKGKYWLRNRVVKVERTPSSSSSSEYKCRNKLLRKNNLISDKNECVSKTNVRYWLRDKVAKDRRDNSSPEYDYRNKFIKNNNSILDKNECESRTDGRYWFRDRLAKVEIDNSSDYENRNNFTQNNNSILDKNECESRTDGRYWFRDRVANVEIDNSSDYENRNNFPKNNNSILDKNECESRTDGRYWFRDRVAKVEIDNSSDYVNRNNFTKNNNSILDKNECESRTDGRYWFRDRVANVEIDNSSDYENRNNFPKNNNSILDKNECESRTDGRYWFRDRVAKVEIDNSSPGYEYINKFIKNNNSVLDKNECESRTDGRYWFRDRVVGGEKKKENEEVKENDSIEYEHSISS